MSEPLALLSPRNSSQANVLLHMDNPIKNNTTQSASTNQIEWSCPLCSLIFVTIFQLREHLRTHQTFNQTNPIHNRTSEAMKHKSSECNVYLSSASEQEMHLIKHLPLQNSNQTQLLNDLKLGCQKQNSFGCIKPFISLPQSEIRPLNYLTSQDQINTTTNILSGITKQENYKCNKIFVGLADADAHMSTSLIHQNANSSQIQSTNNVVSGTLKHVCNKCSESFNTLPELETHMRLHFSSSTQYCKDCGKSCYSKEALDMHICSSLQFNSNFANILSKTGKVQICNICGKTFRTGSYFQLHMRMHSGDSTYSCNVCDKTFSCSWNLKTHLVVHKNEKPFVCGLCGVSFKLKANLLRHERSHVSSKYQIISKSMCGSAIPQDVLNTQTFIEKVKSIGNESVGLKPIPQFINACFSNLKTFKQPVFQKVKHNSTEVDLKLSKTNELNADNLNLGNYEEVENHTSMKKQNSNIYNSMQIQLKYDNTHKVQNEDEYVTSSLGKDKSNHRQLASMHNQSLYGNVNAVCQQLEQIPIEKSKKQELKPETMLVQSMYGNRNATSDSITKEKSNRLLGLNSLMSQSQSSVVSNFYNGIAERHACQVCGKTYKQRCHLLSHLLSHSDARPYVCELCGKSFSLAWNLKTHLAVHNEEKPFSCIICGSNFKLKTTLQRHEKSHLTVRLHDQQLQIDQLVSKRIDVSSKPNRIKELKCPGCDKKYLTFTELRSHMEIHINPECFSCHRCGIDFSCLDELRTHLDICAEFRCNICKEKFSSALNLQVHKLTHN